ncbi:MAG: DUF4350 domain-containing protein [Planctomycetota bacterium]
MSRQGSNEGTPFRRRTAVALAVVGSVSFLGFILVNIFAHDIADVQSSATDSFSSSAIGHKALRSLLEDLGITTAARRNVVDSIDDNDLLILAEPRLDSDDYEQLDLFRDLVEGTPRTLIVLPKRSGTTDMQNPAFNKRVRLRDQDGVDECLDAVGVLSQVDRFVGDQQWLATVTNGVTLVDPDLVEPQLLLPESDVEPILESQDGILVGWISSGEYERGPCWVLADPDPISNHGLHRSDNAVMAVQIIEALRGPGGRVIFDEVYHGHDMSPSVYRDLFRLPLGFATAHGILALALLLWAGTGRFGTPEPVTQSYEAGKEALMRNTAALLAYGGHAGYALERYLSDSISLVAGRLHVKKALDDPELTTTLDKMARSEINLHDLRSDVAGVLAAIKTRGIQRSGRVAKLARRIHRWRREMLDATR